MDAGTAADFSLSALILRGRPRGRLAGMTLGSLCRAAALFRRGFPSFGAARFCSTSASLFIALLPIALVKGRQRWVHRQSIWNLKFAYYIVHHEIPTWKLPWHSPTYLKVSILHWQPSLWGSTANPGLSLNYSGKRRPVGTSLCQRGVGISQRMNAHVARLTHQPPWPEYTPRHPTTHPPEILGAVGFSTYFVLLIIFIPL